MTFDFPALPSVVFREGLRLRPGYRGTAEANGAAPRERVFLGDPDRSVVPYNIYGGIVPAGRDVAVISGSATSLRGFAMKRWSGSQFEDTDTVTVPGLFTMSCANLDDSSVAGMDGAFAFLGKGKDQQLVIVHRVDGSYRVAAQGKLAGRSQCLSMEAPDRLWMSTIVGDHGRNIHRTSTLNEIVLAKGKIKASTKVELEEKTILAASSGGTFYFHDRVTESIRVYESGVLTQTIRLPVSAPMLFAYASAPGQLVVHGYLVSDPGVGFALGYRMSGATHEPWFSFSTDRIETLALLGHSLLYQKRDAMSAIKAAELPA